MASCNYEPWTVKDIASALKNMHAENKEIVVPIFQRGKRWNAKQEEAFIDSLQRGFPVGTMLFYRTVRNEKEIYTLVDGLQRGNTIKKFMSQPTKYFSVSNIPNELVDSIFTVLGLTGNESRIKERISEVFTNAIHSLRSFSGMQFYPIAKEVEKEFPSVTINAVDKILTIIQPFLEQQQDLFEKIEKAIIPVIVYSGKEETLPEIFERINSKGTPLTSYEVYAASWPVDKRFKADNAEIVSYVMKKYDSLADDEYAIRGYNRDEMRRSQELNAFEYAFGFGKFLCTTYPILSFGIGLKADEINTLGFELLNACFNTNKEGISGLFNVILENDMNLVETRIIECIKFVEKVIKPVTRFKGNNRNGEKILHAKYQILSMIAAAFKEKYDSPNFDQAKREWRDNRDILQKNMLHHFVLDIIRNEWGEGGTGKVFTFAKPNRYLKPISFALWESALNNYYEQSNAPSESKKVKNPGKDDLVFLNCIYMSLFTAAEQLSPNSYDVEHIATKDLMKNLITKSGGSGLPISSIANLCYLPEKANRSKRGKTFYQDNNYKAHINLPDVEKKYSFTQEEDLEWTEMDYTRGDYEALKDFYLNFLSIRFKRQKDRFYRSMGIEVLQDDVVEIITAENDIEISNRSESGDPPHGNGTKPAAFHDYCIPKINSYLNTTLQKKRRSVYGSEDNSVGVIVSVSKQYSQGDREKYWFAYRGTSVEILSEYQNKYIGFGCGSADNIILMPLNDLEKAKLKLNMTDTSDPPFWHIVFFKDTGGRWTWLLSKPDVIELSIDDKLIRQ